MQAQTSITSPDTAKIKAGYLVSLGVDSVLAKEYEHLIIRFFEEFKINTPKRISFAMATILHECNWFKAQREQKPSSRLGNYYGRGCVQLTWKTNYIGFYAWLQAKGYDYDVLSFPNIVSDMPAISVLSFCYFLEINKLNELADLNRFVDYQALVNAGNKNAKQINHIEERITLLTQIEKCKHY